MNKEELNHLISNPHLLDSSHEQTLLSYCEKYPYASFTYILYLKALSNAKSIHFEDALHQHAFKINDRVTLYNLIHSYQATENDVASAEKISEETPEIEVLTQIPHEELLDTVELAEEVPVESETTSEIEKNELQQDLAKDDDLEKEYLASIVSSSYQLTPLSEEEKEKLAQKEEIIPQKIVQEVLPEKQSFSSWLKAGDHSVMEEKTESKKTQQIEKEHVEMFSPVKKAKESVDENKLIYSETLANIYAMQGNFSMAIKAFQHLLLTNPEKKRYFAQKINELENKLNQ